MGAAHTWDDCGYGEVCLQPWTCRAAIIMQPSLLFFFAPIRGTGFDRTFWRLPVLLVDDFADITPDLLRTAYVEAVYRAGDFEFERLKQSFWWSVIMNVSASGNIQVYSPTPFHYAVSLS